MAKKKVCISFDYENDKNYKNLLAAWDANTDFEFSFNDLTPKEINSEDIGRIKAVLSQKMGFSAYPPKKYISEITLFLLIKKNRFH